MKEAHYRIFSRLYERTAKEMGKDCQKFIEKRSKILDLGCGSAIVAKVFQDIFQAEILGVDIVDRRIFPIPFKLIEGTSLPFPEKSFDIVLISYVLHHNQDPIALLKEAKRVVKDKIIIYEDISEGIISGLICQIHGFTFNKFFQNSKGNFDFKTENEWEKIFEELGLNIIFKKKVGNFPQKILFVLEHSLSKS